uniref:Uncharacterized protein n=1 Tax=Oryza punctata TaxID=4537 RepID=A0A0E0KPT9_ORYPU
MAKQQSRGFHHACSHQAAQQLHGRDDVKERIIKEILCDTNHVNSCTIICIVAGSGLGKTSLLHVLHNDQRILDAFDKRIWIHMTDKFDKLKFFWKIVEYAIHDHCHITNLSFLEEMVKEELADKKCLFFLDDAEIEDRDFWFSALQVLNSGTKGNVVVIATTSTTVAACTGGATHSYYLNPLSEDNNVTLLQQYACIDQDIQSNPDLMKIAKKFVTRFGENPLNLKALGGLLSHSDTVPLDKLKFEQNNVPCLQLCHDLLPIHLQHCLAFCSLFPKGYIFDKHYMVVLWISQGFVVPVEGRELEDIGIGYFSELLCRSFFEYSPSHSDTDDKFVMHELVFNMVVSVSYNKYFRSEDNLTDIPESICHLSLVSSQIQTVQLMSRTEDLKDLHTLLVIQPEHQQYKTSFPTIILVGLGDFFLKFTSLKTLDLSCTEIEELPSSIAALRRLHYLSLNSTSIRALPSELCSLSNLQTLEAKHCRFLAELPDDTKRLVSLRHLHLGKELGFVRLPPGVGQLTKLQTLPVFHVGHGCSIGELRSLDNLRDCLLVAGLENVSNGGEAREAGLKDKQHLQDLTLQWQDSSIDDDDDDDDAEDVAEQVLDSLQPHPNLQELAIRRYEGSRFPPWMESSSSLPSLVSLTLDSCFSCTQLPAIAQLPSLKFLSVRKTYDVQRLSNGKHGDGVIKFPSLELLNLWEMYGLEELFEASDDGGDCPRLKKICISRCPDLKRLPCVPSVVELVLHCCDELPDIPELVSLRSLRIEGFHGVSSLSLPPGLPALKKLEIRCCDELSSVSRLSELTGVERIKIVRCPKLDWPRSN